MGKLGNIVLGAKLRELTKLRPKKRNSTRWSSTLEIIVRYERIKEFLPKLGSIEVDGLTLTPREYRCIEDLFLQLKDIESVTKVLQSMATSISDVRYTH